MQDFCNKKLSFYNGILKMSILADQIDNLITIIYHAHHSFSNSCIYANF